MQNIGNIGEFRYVPTQILRKHYRVLSHINADHREHMQNLDYIKKQTYGNVCRVLSNICMQTIGNIGEVRSVHISADIGKTLHIFLSHISNVEIVKHCRVSICPYQRRY